MDEGGEHYENDAGNYEEEDLSIFSMHRTFKEIPRFDPKKKAHKEFEVTKAQKVGENESKKRKDSKVNKTQENVYFIDKSIKDKLSGNSDFSLLSIFGDKVPKKREFKDNHFRNVDSNKYVDLYDKHMDHHEPIREVKDWKSKSTNATQLWDNPLFFSSPDDTRLTEGVSFFNNVEPISAEDFKTKRAEIRRVIKLKIRNGLSKKSKSNPERTAPSNKLYALKAKENKKKKFYNKK